MHITLHTRFKSDSGQISINGCSKYLHYVLFSQLYQKCLYWYFRIDQNFKCLTKQKISRYVHIHVFFYHTLDPLPSGNKIWWIIKKKNIFVYEKHDVNNPSLKPFKVRLSSHSYLSLKFILKSSLCYSYYATCIREGCCGRR